MIRDYIRFPDSDTKKSYTHMTHNPGYDFRRMVKWCKDMEGMGNEIPFAPYMVPTIAVFCGCFSIEGYVDTVGYFRMVRWNDIRHKPMQFKLSSLYATAGIVQNFGSPEFAEVFELFQQRHKLAHPRFADIVQDNAERPETVFDETLRLYPASKTNEIVSVFLEKFMRDMNEEDALGFWRQRFYRKVV